jgi:hypothetical protein
MMLVPELVVWFEGGGAIRVPLEAEFVQELLSSKPKFVIDVSCTLIVSPHSKRRVLLVPLWHLTMAIDSFIFEQLFVLLVPELVVWFELVGAVIFPREPDLVQKHLSVWQHFVVSMTDPLCVNPQPKRLIFLVLAWYHTMAILSFIFNQLFILLVPELVVWFEGEGAVIFPSEPDLVQK